SASQTDWLLPEFDRYLAKTYLDFIGPALARHSDMEVLAENDAAMLADISGHPARFAVRMILSYDLLDDDLEERTEEKSERLEAIR
ncbi:hypothetical protein, partial [Bacillus spizizenii]|uniref:hypothetical protein n=1 Tax=Bacillus spizizenii TaxID=96241 RepID=UPI001F617F21